MPVCNAGDAASLFELLDTALERKAIPWAIVVGFESDTNNVESTILFYLVYSQKF